MTRSIIILLATAPCVFAGAVASLQPDVSRLAIHAPQPEYPAEARQKRIGGTGYFVIRVGRASGAVATVEVRRKIQIVVLLIELLIALVVSVQRFYAAR
jgi:hypothetical protein